MKRTLLLIAGIILIAVGALVPVTTTLVVFILPESYASTARIVPAVTDSPAIGTEVEKIQSKLILYQAITNLDLNTKWAARFKADSPFATDVTFLILKSHLDIRRSPNTTLIEVRAFSEDKEEAAKIANEIATVYRDSPFAAKGADAKSVVQIIDKAEPSLHPARPNKPRSIVISIGVGMLLAVVGVMLILFDWTRKNSTQAG